MDADNCSMFWKSQKKKSQTNSLCAEGEPVLEVRTLEPQRGKREKYRVIFVLRGLKYTTVSVECCGHENSRHRHNNDDSLEWDLFSHLLND